MTETNKSNPVVNSDVGQTSNSSNELRRQNLLPGKPKVGAGFGVMLLKNGKVLLGKRHDDPVKASSELKGEGTWTMPGGKIEFGEGLETGAVRELFEETGIRTKEEDLSLVSVSNDMVETAHFVTLGFLCEKFQGEAEVKEPDEITEWRWFDLDKLPKPIYFPSQRVLNNYLNKTIYSKNSR